MARRENDRENRQNAGRMSRSFIRRSKYRNAQPCPLWVMCSALADVRLVPIATSKECYKMKEAAN